MLFFCRIFLLMQRHLNPTISILCQRRSTDMSAKTHFPSAFEHTFTSVKDLTLVLKNLGIQKAILKPLPKNANDKNQIYFASDFSVLYNLFDILWPNAAPVSAEPRTLPLRVVWSRKGCSTTSHGASVMELWLRPRTSRLLSTRNIPRRACQGSSV